MLYWLPEGLTPPLFTRDLMTTSTPAKPRRRRAKRARKPAMTEQQTTQREENLSTTRPFPEELTVKSHLPEVTVLNREAYWSDFKNRLSIHNYEVGEAMKELKVASKWMTNNGRNLVDRIKSVEIS